MVGGSPVGGSLVGGSLGVVGWGLPSKVQI